MLHCQAVGTFGTQQQTAQPQREPLSEVGRRTATECRRQVLHRKNIHLQIIERWKGTAVGQNTGHATPTNSGTAIICNQTTQGNGTQLPLHFSTSSLRRSLAVPRGCRSLPSLDRRRWDRLG